LLSEVVTIKAEAGTGERRRRAARPRWSSFLEEGPGLPRVRTISDRDRDGTPRAAYGCGELNVTESISATNGLLNIIQVDLRSGSITGAGAAGFSAQSTLYASEGAIYLADAGALAPEPGWQSASLIRKFALEGARAGGWTQDRANQRMSGTRSSRVASSDGWASNNLTVLRAKTDCFIDQERELANERIWRCGCWRARLA
jgi:hypothetical protein